MEGPKEIFLKDYKLPDYYVDTVDLSFSLGEEKTIVCAKISVVPRLNGVAAPLALDGIDLKLISAKINGNELKEGDYHLDTRHLILKSPPSENFILETVTEILPQKNTTLEADKSLYPVLLSNGNLIEQGDLEGGKHFAFWEDPFIKPCYLFALVAGQLESRDDTFTTCSGRKVTLRIWTQAQDLQNTEHAMYSLKAAMKWDEDVFGREYDLDLFNIVAVPDFL